MYIVFKEELENNNIKITPLFADEDGIRNRPSLQTIINLLTETIPEENKDNIHFIKMYCHKVADFEDVTKPGISINGDSTVRDIKILVKLKNNHVNEILRVGTYKDNYSDYAEILNSENKDDTISYKVMDVKGKFIDKF